MKLEFNREIKYLNTSDGASVGTEPDTSLSATLINQYGLNSKTFYQNDVYLTREKLDKYFEPVENTMESFFFKEEKKLIPYYPAYKVKEYNCYLIIDLDLQENEDWEQDEVFYNSGHVKVEYIYYDVQDPDFVDMIKHLNGILDFRSPVPKKNKASLVIRNAKGYEVKELSIKPKEIDVDKHYNDDFKEVNDTILSTLKDSNSGIILLHGEPGTGKTNYIKHITSKVPDKKFIYIPSNMIGFITDPSFIGTMLSNKNSILIIEDCEVYIQDRKNSGGSNSNFVTTLLNLSDGILSDMMDLQIICTFNNDIKDIDEAILREGRLIAEYKFDELSQVKTDVILKEIDQTLDKGKKRTLANIYNSGKKVHRTKAQTKIGF